MKLLSLHYNCERQFLLPFFSEDKFDSMSTLHVIVEEELLLELVRAEITGKREILIMLNSLRWGNVRSN